MSHKSRRQYYQGGMSLIELMIAMLIGTVLIAGLLQVFSASRSAYQLSRGLARNQENARFALDFLSRDLRMVGHSGCVNDKSLLRTSSGGAISGGNIRSLFMTTAQRTDNTVSALAYPLRFDVSIQGYEAVGTGPAVSTAISLPTTPTVGVAADWSPTLPNALANGLSPKPLKGSDIVVLRFLSEEQAPVFALNLSAVPATIDYPSGSAKVATEGTGLFGLADCNSATVFAATANPSSTRVQTQVGTLNKSAMSDITANDGSLSYKAGGAILYRAQVVVYYLGMSAGNNGIPALYRAYWKAAPSTGALSLVTEEIVDGIDSLQFLYGEDSESVLTNPATGRITRMNTAATIGDESQALRWRRVGAVQLGLLVRGGSERSSALQPTATPRVLGTPFAPENDGNYRSVYETTIAFRNRLFGN